MSFLTSLNPTKQFFILYIYIFEHNHNALWFKKKKSAIYWCSLLLNINLNVIMSFLGAIKLKLYTMIVSIKLYKKTHLVTLKNHFQGHESWKKREKNTPPPSYFFTVLNVRHLNACSPSFSSKKEADTNPLAWKGHLLKRKAMASNLKLAWGGGGMAATLFPLPPFLPHSMSASTCIATAGPRTNLKGPEQALSNKERREMFTLSLSQIPTTPKHFEHGAAVD